jgi:hypothetical protein
MIKTQYFDMKGNILAERPESGEFYEFNFDGFNSWWNHFEVIKRSIYHQPMVCRIPPPV